MNWRIPTLVIGVLLAISATFVVFAGPDDGSDDSSAAVEEPGEGDVSALPQGDGNHVGQEAIAQAIADAFSTEGEEPVLIDDVFALREEGIGFGALFQLYALAAVMEGTSVGDLLALHQAGTGLGELRNGLTAEQVVDLESFPKNLGRSVSDNKPGGNGTDEVTLETGQKKSSNQVSRGNGRPSNVSNGSPKGGPNID